MHCFMLGFVSLFVGGCSLLRNALCVLISETFYLSKHPQYIYGLLPLVLRCKKVIVHKILKFSIF